MWKKDWIRWRGRGKTFKGWRESEQERDKQGEIMKKETNKQNKIKKNNTTYYFPISNTNDKTIYCIL